MNRIFKNIVGIVLLFASVVYVAQAGNPKRTGTAGAQELLIPVGAKSLALGGANIANITGADAMYWNPAGLARTEAGTEVLFSQMNYIADIGVSYGAVNINAGDIGFFGFSVKSLGFGEIPRTTEDFPDGTGELFSPTFVVGSASYSKLLNDRVSVGVVFNLISEKIMSTSSTGMGIDLGVMYHGLVWSGLNLGIVVKNIGPNMSFDGSNLYRTADVATALRDAQFYKVETESFELPTDMEIGLSYTHKLSDLNVVTISSDFQNNNYLQDEYKFSGEYGYDNMIFLRGGYVISPKTEADAYIYDYSFGAGVNFDLGGVGFRFDYAFRNVKYFQANNVIAVSLAF